MLFRKPAQIYAVIFRQHNILKQNILYLTCSFIGRPFISCNYTANCVITFLSDTNIMKYNVMYFCSIADIYCKCSYFRCPIRHAVQHITIFKYCIIYIMPGFPGYTESSNLIIPISFGVPVCAFSASSMALANFSGCT